MYAITGATGNTGSVVTEKLLAHGQKVRVIGREASRLGRFVQKGAEPFVADVTDAAALGKAFAGEKAVYAMIPPNITSPDVRSYEERVGDALAAAIKNAGVEYTVTLSSIGADKTEKTGPIIGLHNLEQKLNNIGSVAAIHLRAGYFMENLLPQIGIIQNFGMMAGPVRGDLELPLIATRDIGAAAADALLKLGFRGKQTRELLGARNVTYNEAASIISRAISKPGLKYAQLPHEQLRPALLQLGMSSSMIDLLLEMADALNSGYIVALEARSPENTTPTSIETFVADSFAPQFKAKAARA